MIGFTNPTLLWCLTGVVIPIVIHLLSRKQSGIIYAGSLRHLDLSFSQQFKSLRLNELMLLLLRMFFLTFMVLLLSGMWISARNEKKWLVTENGISFNQPLTSLRDSLLKLGYEQHILAPNFPLSGARDTISPVTDYWELSNRLSALRLSDVVVFARERVASLRGQRPALPENQHWIAVPSAPHSFLLNASRKKHTDSITVRTGNTDSRATSFTNKVVRWDTLKQGLFYKPASSSDSVLIENSGAVTVTIITAVGFENDEKILLNAIKALETISGVPIQITHGIGKQTGFNFLLDLKDQAVKDSSQPIGFDSKTADPVLEQLSDRRWKLTKHLTIAEAIDEHLTIKLGEILFPGTFANERLSRNDARTLGSSLWADAKIQKIPAQLNRQDLSRLLIVLLLLTLFIERNIALRRNQ